MVKTTSEKSTVLSDQVIFINGACGLIGERFVDVCLNAGASVVAADIDATQLSDLSARIESSKLFTQAVDLTSALDVQKALDKSVQHFGLVTAVVNGAYPRNKRYGRRFFDVEYADFCENLSLNVGTTFSVCQIFARYFKEQHRGNIINLGSIYGVMAPDFDIYPDPMTMPVEYAAIKSAVIHLTKYMAQMLRKEGVQVNCISPGGVLDSQPEVFLERYSAKCGQQGMLLPENLDSTLLYLLSPHSKAVTGQNIIVDDGFSL